MSSLRLRLVLSAVHPGGLLSRRGHDVLRSEPADGLTTSSRNCRISPYAARLLFPFVFCLAVLFLFPSFGLAQNIYIAQAAAGSGTGADCADALPYTFFNTPANWGTAAGQIGPGTTVHLCGTIASELTAQGSGAAGSPIKILFESGAKISMPVCAGSNGCLGLGKNSYITVDGGSNGIIENTANGTGLANEVNSDGITFRGSNITIENLTVQNIYVRIPGQGDTNGQSTYFISGGPTPESNITIRNNVMHDSRWGVGVSAANFTFSGNNEYHMDHCLSVGGGGTYSNVYIFGNQFHDWSNWDSTSGYFHHDGIHFFSGSPNTVLSNVYIYDNMFNGHNGMSMTGFIFAEESVVMSNVYIFNNVMIEADNTTDGTIFVSDTGSHYDVLNNTSIAVPPAGAVRGACISLKDMTSLRVENNIMDTCGVQMGISGTATFVSGGLNDNLYANMLSPYVAWSYMDTFYSSLGAWQKATGGDADAAYYADADLSAEGQPLSGSPVAKMAGANLTSLCSGQPNPGLGALCFGIRGTPRPATGPWSVGAYQVPSGPIPQNLRITKGN